VPWNGRNWVDPDVMFTVDGADSVAIGLMVAVNDWVVDPVELKTRGAANNPAARKKIRRLRSHPTSSPFCILGRMAFP